eukprot:TRINITY_DN1461_c1_g2_i3.p1 TRINITY_DN1461_c1_g2~~TRINITY_DN1461_c1_g2_i3.p1  ORF type:complete len:357 (-),score=63.78 TRINITY_DN1461_c1_g2_i3:18-1088(-)
MQARKHAGSACWMAPEMFGMKDYNEKVDVYAFGLIMWQLINKQEYPYKLEKYKDNLSKLVHDIVVEKKRPKISAKLDTSIVSILERSWDHDPDKRPSFGEILKLLDEVIVSNTLLKDADAIKMWRDNFPGREEVPVDSFISVLFKTLNVKLPKNDNLGDPIVRKKKCIEVLVNDRYSGNHVSLQRFGMLLTWFGPLLPIGRKTSILDTIVDICAQPWYHGDILRDEAHNTLSIAKRGSFLVRTSDKPQFPFTLSRTVESSKSANSVEHTRIAFNSTTGMYSFLITGKSKSKNLESETLSHLMKIIIESKLLKLKHECKCTKFAYIFANTPAVTYNYSYDPTSTVQVSTSSESDDSD